MISYRHRCVFVHQRKCAGISIMRAFGLCSPSDSTPELDWYFMNDGLLHGEVPPPDFFKFAVVRNPYDRFVSGWQYVESLRQRPLRDVLLHLPEPSYFPDWRSDPYTHVSRLQRDTLYRDGHLIVDHLIRFEQLQEGFDHVCDVVGLPHQTLPHLNASAGRRPYREYFTDEADRQLFLQHFRPDFEAFGYSP